MTDAQATPPAAAPDAPDAPGSAMPPAMPPAAVPPTALPEPDLPTPIVIRNRRARLSLVWLVPLLALAIGASLVVRSLLQAGPSIEIEFRTAEGLEAGKTEVRFKEVVIGRVQSVLLTDNRQRVVAVVKLDRAAAVFTAAGRHHPCCGHRRRHGTGRRAKPGANARRAGRPAAAGRGGGAGGVFSKPGMSLERPEIDDAKRVDPL